MSINVLEAGALFTYLFICKDPLSLVVTFLQPGCIYVSIIHNEPPKVKD